MNKKELTKLIRRKNCKGGNHYYFTDSKNRKWSVVDIRNMMSTTPMFNRPEWGDCFDYWEAILTDKDGELNSGIMLREKTSTELLNKIQSYES